MAKSKPDHGHKPSVEPKHEDPKSGDKAEENKAEAPKAEPKPEPAKAKAEPAKDTVTMNFKAPLKLNDGGEILSFNAGVNEVPARLQDHWYLTAHGVTLYAKKK
jgi:hypothetical protein